MIDCNKCVHSEVCSISKNNGLSGSCSHALYIDRPLIIYCGQVFYLNQGYIDALIEYEKKELEKETINKIIKNFGG